MQKKERFVHPRLSLKLSSYLKLLRDRITVADLFTILLMENSNNAFASLFKNPPQERPKPQVAPESVLPPMEQMDTHDVTPKVVEPSAPAPNVPKQIPAIEGRAVIAALPPKPVQKKEAPKKASAPAKKKPAAKAKKVAKAKRVKAKKPAKKVKKMKTKPKKAAAKKMKKAKKVVKKNKKPAKKAMKKGKAAKAKKAKPAKKTAKKKGSKRR